MKKKMSTAESANDAHKQDTLQNIWELVFYKANFLGDVLTR